MAASRKDLQYLVELLEKSLAVDAVDNTLVGIKAEVLENGSAALPAGERRDITRAFIINADGSLSLRLLTPTP